MVCFSVNFTLSLLGSFEWNLYSSMDHMNNLLKTETRVNGDRDGFTFKYTLRSIPEG